MFVGLFHQFRRYVSEERDSMVHARSSILLRRGRREGNGWRPVRAIDGEEFVGELLDRQCETEEQARARIGGGYILLARALGFVLSD